MLLTLFDLVDFDKVIDDATGQVLTDVRWIDTDALEYGVISQPPRFVFGTFVLETDPVKVTRVQLDYVNKVIHVNDPPLVAASPGIVVRELHACGECRQAECCRRLGICVRFKVAFGECNPP